MKIYNIDTELLIDALRQKFANHKSMLQNGAWLMLLQLFNTVFPLLTIPYITRILSTEGFGNFSIALNWVSYFQVFVEYGFELSATRKLAISKSYAEDCKLYSCVILDRFILFLISGIAIAAIIIFSTTIVISKKYLLILSIMTLGTVLQHNWFFQGKEDMQFITISNVLCRTITTALIFIYVKSSEDTALYCILYSVNYIFVGIMGALIAKIKYRMKFIKCTLTDLLAELKDGWYIFTSSAMIKICSEFGMTYLSFVSTAQAVGIYAAMFKFPRILSLIWMPIHTIIYPYSSKAFSVSQENGIAFLKKIFLPIMLCFLLVSTLIILMSKEIINFIFGVAYISGAPLIFPHLTWFMLGIYNNIFGIQMLVASGNGKKYSQLFMCNAISSVILTLLLGHYFKTIGVAYALMLSELFLSFLYTLNHNTSKQR